MNRNSLAVCTALMLGLAACGSSDVTVSKAPPRAQTKSTPATVSGMPTYHHSDKRPAKPGAALIQASSYSRQPGAAIATPKGNVTARRVLVGNSAYVVFTDVGRNSPAELAIAINGTEMCYVPEGAMIHRIGITKGWTMPCLAERPKYAR